MPLYHFDAYYILLVVPAIILSMIVQMRLKTTYAKFKKINNTKGYTGADMARKILANGGAGDVRVECIGGILSDHFDPRAKCVRLSSEVYNGTSVASIGIAAHECGHALQYATGYAPIRVRSAAVRLTNISSSLIYPLIILSVIFQFYSLIDVAVICFLVIFLFQLITLPVEFNASRRAVQIIEQNGFSPSDVVGVKKVLSSAAMTYVAAMIVALMNLLSFFLRTRRRD